MIDPSTTAKTLLTTFESKVKEAYSNYDFVMSFSSYNQYHNCPIVFFHRYVQRRKLPFDQRNAVIGIMAQRMVELWLTTNQEGRPHDFFDQAVDESLAEATVNWRGPNDKDSVISDLRNHLDLIHNAFVNYQLAAPVNLMELKMAGDIGVPGVPVPMVGVADQISIFPDHVRIIDGKYFMKAKKSEPSQLMLYACFISQVLPGLPISVGFWYYRQGKVDWLTIPAHKVEMALTTFRCTYDMITKQIFSGSPATFYCSSKICPLYNECERRTQAPDKMGEVSL
jgi:hypothetical protein